MSKRRASTAVVAASEPSAKKLRTSLRLDKPSPIRRSGRARIQKQVKDETDSEDHTSDDSDDDFEAVPARSSRGTRGSRAKAQERMKKHQQVVDSDPEEEEVSDGDSEYEAPNKTISKSSTGVVIQPVNSFLSDSSSSDDDCESSKPDKKPSPPTQVLPSTSKKRVGSSDCEESQSSSITQEPNDFAAVEKNILAGVSKVADSESSDEEMKEVEDNPDFIPTHVLFPQFMPQARENSDDGDAKKKLVKSEPKDEIGKLDVSELLALGESQAAQEKDLKKETGKSSSRNKKSVKLEEKKGSHKSKSTASSSRTIKSERRRQDSETDGSEWEEVEHKEVSMIPREGVEVTVELPNIVRKKKKKGVDVDSIVKRRINQMVRERQVLVHKVSLLCWVGHGLHVNSLLNSPNLMGCALSLIPSQHSYPPGKLDLKYLERITGWFKKTVPVTNSEEPAKKTLLEILEESFLSKKAYNKRILVLMFVCMMRSLGTKTRLVVSLQPLPLKPSAEALCTISNNPSTSKESNKKASNKNVQKEEKSGKKNESKSNKVPAKSSNKSGPSMDKSTKCASKSSSPSKSPQKSSKSPSPQKESSKNKSSHSKSGTSSPYFNKKSMYFDAKSEPASKLNNREQSRRESCSSKSRSETRPALVPREEKRDRETRSKNTGSEKKSNEERMDTMTPQRENSISPKKSRGTNKKAKDDEKKSSRSRGKEDHKQCAILVEKKKKPESKIKKEEEQASKRSLRTRRPSKYKEDSSDGESKSEKHKPSRSLPDAVAGPSSRKESFSDDDDFKPEVIRVKKSEGRVKDRKVLSSEEEGGSLSKVKKGDDWWVEVFVEAEEKWICVDVERGKVHCVAELRAGATTPVLYVLAFGGVELTCIRDVTRRYCPQFHSTNIRKMRVETHWWDSTLKPWFGRRTAYDKEEERDLERQLQDRPLPTTVSEYKNHPLYALKRHLLKFEAIYPPEAPSLGFIRGEPVYSRDCVFTLRSRETWVKEAKVVRPGEQPYKIVKARPKYDRMSGQMVTDKPLEIFGPWQVGDYEPPTAKDGKVPRNEYGNVELFKPTMLPKGTVHLKVPCLNRIAKKLQIDCAPAMVGFDYHCGGCHPVFEGFVVCEEFKDTLLDAHRQDEEERERRQEEKRLKRVLGNWKRLVNAVFIRENLKRKYDLGGLQNQSGAAGSASKKLSVNKAKPTKRATTKAVSESSDSDYSP